MSAHKAERLLQLVLCLSAAHVPVTRDQLRQAVPDYADCPTDEAFERMFERDKGELRDLGVPVTTRPVDPAHEEEVGYLVDRRAWVLPEVVLDPDEATAVALAARLWQEAGPAAAAARALRKLQSAGVAVAEDALPAVEPRLSGGEAALAPLAAAVTARRPVRFGYRAAGSGQVTERTVEPWAVVLHRGRWYLIGHDRDRDDTRVFRLSRIAGAVAGIGTPGSVVVPPGADPRGRVASFAAEGAPGQAVLAVRPGTGHGLRRRAVDSRPGADGRDLVTVEYRDGGALAGEVASYGDAVAVVEPPELRDDVRRLWQGVLAEPSP